MVFVAGSTTMILFFVSGEPTGGRRDGGVAQRPGDWDAGDDGVGGRVDAGHAGGGRYPDRVAGCGGPGGRVDRDRRDDGVRSRVDADDCVESGRPDGAEGADDPCCGRELESLDDLVSSRVDSVDLAAAVGCCPGGAEGEGGVVRCCADGDGGGALAGANGYAADGVRVCVLDPERAGAEAEPAGAETDLGAADDDVAAWVDLEQVGRGVGADPDEASAAGCGARLDRAGDRDARDDRGSRTRRSGSPRWRRVQQRGRGCVASLRNLLRFRITFLRNRINLGLRPDRMPGRAPRAPRE